MALHKTLPSLQWLRNISRLNSVVLRQNIRCASHTWGLPLDNFFSVDAESETPSLARRCQSFLCPAHPAVAQVQKRFYSDDKKKTEVTYMELLALLESHDIQLFDVREPKEIQENGTIPNSTNIPLTKVKEALKMDDIKFAENYGVPRPNKYDRNLVFFGKGPIKSTAALELAHKLGYKMARHYPGGYEEWSNKQGQKS